MSSLKLLVLNGGRSNKKISLKKTSKSAFGEMPFILESEAIEFSLETASYITKATLCIYDYQIEYSKFVYDETKNVNIFFWSPKQKKSFGSEYEVLFSNFFGVADIQVELQTVEGLHEIINYSSVEILASKMSAERVELMLSFLAKLPDSEIYSAFHATKLQSNFVEGSVRPDIVLERLEKIVSFLEKTLPSICHSPITRLTPKQRIEPYQDNTYTDETTISWLLENLSVLVPTDDDQKVTLRYEEDLYLADSLQVPVIMESCNLYENQVIHGFIELLQQQCQTLYQKLDFPIEASRSSSNYINEDYKSFFTIISRFSKGLLEPQKRRFEKVSSKLKFLQYTLDKYIPVRAKVRERPRITSKARVNRVYFEIFHRAISYHEYGQPDWSAYENLFGIKSIPILFENYCYFRVLDHLQTIFGNRDKDGLFFDSRGSEVELQREPNYWAVGHANSILDNVVNTEGWTTSPSKKVTERKSRGPNSRRSPDIVIKVTRVDGASFLLVMDAKYSNEVLSFVDYLPKLTMKYLHGLHFKGRGVMAAKSLTIIYPNESGSVKSFHNQDYAFDGVTPAEPSLQIVGVAPSEEVDDRLPYLLETMLSSNGVEFTNRASN